MAFGNLITPRTNDYGSEWNAGMVLSEEESTPLFQLIEQQLEDVRKRNSKFPKSNEKLKFPYQPGTKKNDKGEKELVEGEWLWIFNRKTERTINGESRRVPAPIIWDANGTPVKDLTEVPRGTEGVVHFECRCWSRGASGVSFYLLGMQIAKLGETTTPDLTPIEGAEFVLDDGATPVDLGAILDPD